MSLVFITPPADFPQQNTNRTCGNILTDLLQFTGGTEDADAQEKAKLALQMAVREYNGILWNFNRVTQDITLTAETDFTLAAAFRAPLAATLLDSSNENTWTLSWLPWEEFIFQAWDRRGTGSMPLVYTARNVHETGVVTVWPKLTTPLTWPTMRMEYFRRILIPSGVGDTLNVPEEIEEGIVQRALAILIAMTRTYREARDQLQIAAAIKETLKMEYRGYPDF